MAFVPREARSVQRDLKAISGIAAPTGAYVVSRRFRSTAGVDANDPIGEAIGPKRIATDPSTLIKEFEGARSGNLAVYCQLFWPAFRRPEKLRELERACIAHLAQRPKDVDCYQLRLLPVLANIHALSAGNPDLDQKCQEVISQAVRSAREGVGEGEIFGITKDRDILDMSWRALTCALTRNEETWAGIVLDAEILAEAEQTIVQFLEGEAILFAPAVSAFQLLLTYAKAGTSRTDASIENARRHISSVLAHKAADVAWLKKLDHIYSQANNLDQMRPQVSEIFMAYAHNIFDSETRDFGALASMQKIVANAQAASNNSPYIALSRAREYMVWPEALPRYGFHQADWSRLREQYKDQHVLSNATVEYIESGIRSADSSDVDADKQLTEQFRATSLGLWVPFRKRDEEAIFARVFEAGDLDSLLKLYDDPPADALTDLWERAIAFEGASLSEQCALSDSRRDIVDRAFKQIPDESVSKHAEIIAELLDRAKSIVRVSILGAALAGAPQEALGDPEERNGRVIQVLKEREDGVVRKEDSATMVMEDLDLTEYEETANIPDFNLLPFNGDTRDDISRRFHVRVQLLGPRDESIGAYPISIGGDLDAVANYVTHLQSTWPKAPNVRAQ